MRLSKLLKVSGYLLLTAAAILFAIGMYTNSWRSVSGKILQINATGYYSGGYVTPKASRGGNVNIESASYSYYYNGNLYKGNRICYCLPIGFLNPTMAIHTDIEIYVNPMNPESSVIIPGPDMFSIIALVLVGCFLIIAPDKFRKIFMGA